MGELISVIVPVYNSGQYISSCAESVLMQTYSDIELLLVDDGSEDNSLEICEDFCKKDNRIRLIKQEHGGVSAARNLGIEAAEGKYLFFLDSDDTIHPQLLEALYKLQEERHTVIAAEGRQYGRDDIFLKTSDVKTAVKSMPKSFYLDNKKALKYINRPILCGIGGKLILRKAINSVRFNENLSHGEDTLFIYQLLANGADLSVLCRNWYYYRMHKDNASRNFSLKPCRDRYRVERYICNCEIRNGRIQNAVFREWNIVIRITEWYGAAKMHQNQELMKYIRNLAKREKKLKIFHRLNWWRKLYFYLFLYCYPVSGLALKVSKKI